MTLQELIDQATKIVEENPDWAGTEVYLSYSE